MRAREVGLLLGVSVTLLSSPACAQKDLPVPEVAPASQAQTQVDTGIDRSHILEFSGVLKDHEGQRLTGVVGVLFAIYAQKEGGAPLWQEVQNVDVNKRGHFAVLVGETTNEGIPSELFATEKTRWLGIQVLLPSEVEQPRICLVGAPSGLRTTRLILPNRTSEEMATADVAAQPPGGAQPKQEEQSEPPNRPRRAKGRFQRPRMP